MTESQIVHKDRAQVRLDVPGAHLVLLTCYPFTAWTPGGPLRYAVVAEAVR